ncbi:unnamed protein product [Callosobruchus maculatus]|uniref:Uncharacterized protein n=1 Tax=Callosobruchus maculatus TaxID=64391 RepID=A0A653BFG1_CALMS|nr:unnamed protein product [Callosobruchus maculatus]
MAAVSVKYCRTPPFFGGHHTSLEGHHTFFGVSPSRPLEHHCFSGVTPPKLLLKKSSLLWDAITTLLWGTTLSWKGTTRTTPWTSHQS